MAAKIRFANRHFHLPQSKPIRVGLGILLVAFGLVGFLPVVGFWMIPLGLLVLSVDVPIVRRWRRQLAVWWHRDRKERGGRGQRNGAPAKDPAGRRSSDVLRGGGHARNRTGVRGFAVRCVTTPPRGQVRGCSSPVTRWRLACASIRLCKRPGRALWLRSRRSEGEQ